MCLLILILYAAGTIQEFIDSTQLSLLRLYVFLGISLVISSIYSTILNLGQLIETKQVHYLFRACGYVFLVVFGVATVLVVMFIIIISEGNGAQ